MGVLSSLSPDQKNAIRESWTVLEKSKKEIGSAFFAKLIITYPQYKPLFRRMKDTPNDDLVNNKANHVHSILFMQGIGALVSFLDDEDYADEVLHKIANRHMHLTVTESDLNKAGDLFVDFLKSSPALSGLGHSPDAIAAAWKQAFHAVNPAIAKYTDDAKAGK